MNTELRKRLEEAAVYYNNNASATDASFGAFESGYIKGATEQKRIDIDKACEWLKNRLSHLDPAHYNYDYDKMFTNFVEDFREDIEKSLLLTCLDIQMIKDIFL